MRQIILKFTGVSRLTRIAHQFPFGRRMQKAQGMVEFALVLPILLMLLLGIIAFSHLFFVYSMTVSASREAARWGAAVGITGSGVPRYRDCQSIRDAAVRTGGIVGVSADHIVIQYDRGPDPTKPGQSLAPYNTCPAPGQTPFGPIESDVRLGDRILVTVNVDYQSIVPFINIPSRTLTAVTARTIIKSLPVGEAPVADDPCGKTASTQFTIVPPLPEYPTLLELKAGEQLTMTGNVIIKETGEGAPGTVTWSDEGNLHSIDGDAGTPLAYFWYYTEASIGQEYDILFNYQSGTECPSSYSAPFQQGRVHIGKADTTTQIVSHLPAPSGRGQAVTVTVWVKKVAAATLPGSVGTGQVVVKNDIDGATCTVTSLNPATGQGFCSLIINNFGLYKLTATYTGSAQYNASTSLPVDHTVTDFTKTPTPTTTVTPTRTPTVGIPVITKTPTKTPLPAWCPSASAFNFNGLDSVLFNVTNPNVPGANPVTLTSAYIDWVEAPPKPVFEELRFGADTSADCKSGGPCIWSGVENNTPVIIGAGGNAFNGTASTGLALGETKQLRFAFSRNLHNGLHYVTLVFSNNCILELAGNRELSK